MKKLPLSERWLYQTSRGALPQRRAAVRALGRCYQTLQRLHAHTLTRWRTPERLDFPIISVGSILIGGAGKTPIARWCAEALAQRSPGVVGLALRGYGRRGDAPVVLTTSRGDALPPWEAVGDEAWMLCESLQRGRAAGRVVVAVGASRLAALTVAQAVAPTLRVAVLDDGFQHRRLHRDLDVVIIPPGVERLELLPAGPLREPLESLRRADILWTHAGDGRLPDRARPDAVARTRYALPTLRRPWDGAEAAPRDLGAARLLSAVGRNQNVSTLLEDAGVRVVEHVALRDHRRFSLGQTALRGGGPIVTTAKDWPRLQAVCSAETRARVWVMEPELVFERGERRINEALSAVARRRD